MSSTKQPRILYVEDRQRQRELVADRLRRQGYDVVDEGDAKVGLAIFQSEPFGFDVVLTDLDFRETSGECDGVWLMNRILNLRDKRGYDPGPEIICMTSVYIDPNLANRIRRRGGQFILKGSPQTYLLEIEAALERLETYRSTGPNLLFLHAAAENASWNDEHDRSPCVVGESVNSVYVVTSGNRERVPLSKKPLLLFDYLARRASRFPLRVEEVANGFVCDEFYYFWMGRERDQTLSSDTVKVNVGRIRAGLSSVFQKIQLHHDPNHVLSTERIHDPDGEDDDALAYRLHANILIQHIP
jgi:CheY-like chemotaxis protein